MPASTAHITVAGKASLNQFLRNRPVDQVAVGRPFLRKLRLKKKTFAGGKQHIVVQLRKGYDSSGQWYYGEQLQTFNKRDTLEQAFFAWTGFRDGYTMSTDEFIENGLSISDDSRSVMTGDELVILTDLFKERNEALMLGFEEELDRGFKRNGSYSTDAIKGLDHLIGGTATSGTVGALNRATFTWWRPNQETGLTKANILQKMREGWRQCVRNGGMPDYIQMGESALETYIQAVEEAIGRRVNLPMGGGQPQMDGGTGVSVDGGVQTGFSFKGVPIVWDPTDEQMDTAEGKTSADADSWLKRIYMLNCNHIQEMPVKRFDEVAYVPPTVYNREAHFFGRRWKGAMIMKRANAHWTGYTT